MSAALQVTEYDRFGNVATNDSASEVSLFANGHGHLDGEPVVAGVSNGVANFSNDLTLDAIGDYTLTASSSAAGTLTVTSGSFSVGIGPAAALYFTPVPPSSIEQGSTLGTVVVAEYDQFGNLVASDNSTMVTLSASACGGTSLGSQPLTAGQASFATTQSFRTAASGLTLSASAAPLTLPMAATANFDVIGIDDYIFFDGYELCRP